MNFQKKARKGMTFSAKKAKPMKKLKAMRTKSNERRLKLESFKHSKNQKKELKTSNSQDNKISIRTKKMSSVKNSISLNNKYKLDKHFNFPKNSLKEKIQGSWLKTQSQATGPRQHSVPTNMDNEMFLRDYLASLKSLGLKSQYCKQRQIYKIMHLTGFVKKLGLDGFPIDKKEKNEILQIFDFFKIKIFSLVSLVDLYKLLFYLIGSELPEDNRVLVKKISSLKKPSTSALNKLNFSFDNSTIKFLEENLTILKNNKRIQVLYGSDLTTASEIYSKILPQENQTSNSYNFNFFLNPNQIKHSRMNTLKTQRKKSSASGSQMNTSTRARRLGSEHSKRRKKKSKEKILKNTFEDSLLSQSLTKRMKKSKNYDVEQIEGEAERELRYSGIDSYEVETARKRITKSLEKRIARKFKEDFNESMKSFESERDKLNIYKKEELKKNGLESPRKIKAKDGGIYNRMMRAVQTDRDRKRTTSRVKQKKDRLKCLTTRKNYFKEDLNYDRQSVMKAKFDLTEFKRKMAGSLHRKPFNTNNRHLNRLRLSKDSKKTEDSKVDKIPTKNITICEYQNSSADMTQRTKQAKEEDQTLDLSNYRKQSFYKTSNNKNGVDERMSNGSVLKDFKELFTHRDNYSELEHSLSLRKSELATKRAGDKRDSFFGKRHSVDQLNKEKMMNILSKARSSLGKFVLRF